MRFPSKNDAFRFLKSIGLSFPTILDVGVNRETEELRLSFPHSRHLLFEPAHEFYPHIKQNYQGMNFEIVPVAASNKDGQRRLHRIEIAGGGEVTHTHVSDNMADAEIDTIRLDTFMTNRQELKPYLLKLDVDGHEIPIMEGAEGIFRDIDIVVIEAPLDSFAERMNFLVARGYTLIDVVDPCYYFNMLSGVDLIFASNELIARTDDLRPWQTKKFSWDRWEQFALAEPMYRNAGY